MSQIASGSYQGSLRTINTHLTSGEQILTDAPTDNHGLGQAFSPTDLLAASLGACMVTVMCIRARQLGQDPEGLSWTVEKDIAASPRRVARIGVRLEWQDPKLAPSVLAELKEVALTCPVAKSLHPDLVQDVHFSF